MARKIIDHPTARLARILDEQSVEIQRLNIDCEVLRDLLVRTIRILARQNVAQMPAMCKTLLAEATPSKRKKRL